MHALYKLKELLCKELESYGDRTQLDRNSLSEVDTLSHALKNLDKVIEAKEMEQYSEAMSREGMSRDGMSRNGYSGGTIDDGMGHYHWPNYTRFSMEGGSSRYSREGSSREGSSRYSREGSRRSYGYSGNEEMVEQLRELMEDAPDENTRKEMQRLISKMEKM